MSQPHPTPKSCLDLFWSFTLIALQGFGGVLAIIQHEIVDRKKWLSREEFIEEWAIAQILPGPNVVNLSLMLGARYFGLRGALSSLAGMLCIPGIIALFLGVLYATYSTNAAVMRATNAMSAVAAGLIIATGIKLMAGLKWNALGLRLCSLFGLICFMGVALLRWPLLEVLVVLGPIACGLAYRALKVSR